MPGMFRGMSGLGRSQRSLWPLVAVFAAGTFVAPVSAAAGTVALTEVRALFSKEIAAAIEAELQKSAFGFS